VPSDGARETSSRAAARVSVSELRSRGQQHAGRCAAIFTAACTIAHTAPPSIARTVATLLVHTHAPARRRRRCTHRFDHEQSSAVGARFLVACVGAAQASAPPRRRRARRPAAAPLRARLGAHSAPALHESTSQRTRQRIEPSYARAHRSTEAARSHAHGGRCAAHSESGAPQSTHGTCGWRTADGAPLTYRVHMRAAHGTPQIAHGGRYTAYDTRRTVHDRRYMRTADGGVSVTADAVRCTRRTADAAGGKRCAPVDSRRDRRQTPLTVHARRRRRCGRLRTAAYLPHTRSRCRLCARARTLALTRFAM
jgi:hypothetical protein